MGSESCRQEHTYKLKKLSARQSGKGGLHTMSCAGIMYSDLGSGCRMMNVFVISDLDLWEYSVACPEVLRLADG